ncbi:MAG: hypothetical protein PHS60_15105 [Zavarzinia sp.]|nr:hypothetical protein [Zavarzinia sp.]
MAEIVAAGTNAIVRAVHGVRVQRPLFYPETMLVELLTRRPATEAGFDGGTMLFALGPGYIALLDGTSPVVHAINGETPPILDDVRALEAYLRFFGHVVCGEAGAFQIVATPDDLPPFVASPVVDKIIAATLSEPVLLARDGAGNQDMAATLLYSATLFDVVLRVSAAGTVDMIEDDPVATDLPMGAFHIIDGTRRVLLPRPGAH